MSEEANNRPVRKGYKQLIETARAQIRTLSLDEAHAMYGQPDVVFVDIRDVREMTREGLIPGAYHAPRGMLEFWVDPDSPYFREIFGTEKTFVLYCNKGWRSSLATLTLQEMGMHSVTHFAGGFDAWKSAKLPVGEKPQRGKQ